MNDKLKHLASLIGPENLFTDPASLSAYSKAATYSDHQGQLPMAVARPRHPAQLARMLAYCATESIQIAVRGNGTKANVYRSSKGRLLLVTTGLNRIHEIDSQNRVALIQAGVNASSFRQTLAQKELFCPLGNFGTIGGFIAVNPASCQALKYGSICNFLHSLEVCLTNGEILHLSGQTGLGGQTCETFPGASLICGSEGSLGVITSCRLRLLPKPEACKALAFKFSDLAEAAEALKSIMASSLLPDKLDFYDARSAIAANLGDSPIVVARFSGSTTEVENYAIKTQTLLKKEGAPVARAPEDEDIFPGLRKQMGAFQIAQLTCPPEFLGNAFTAISDSASQMRLSTSVFGDGATAKILIAITETGDNTAVESFRAKLFASELLFNNGLESESDAELSREQWQAKHTSKLRAQLMRIFDPAGILADPQEYVPK